MPRHLLAGLLGLLILATGYLALAGFVFVLVILLLDLTRANSRVNLADEWPWWPIMAITGLVLVPIGLRMLRGRRRLVLFLRRFGLSTSTAAMTRAITDGMGSRWRVVTLDDHSVAPVGVDQTPRRRLRWARYLTLFTGLVVVGGIWALFLPYWNGPTPDLQAFFGKLVLLLVVGVSTLILVAFFVAAMVGFVAASWFARSADRSRMRAIVTAEDINPVAKRVAATARHVFAPRLVVLRVDNSCWQQVVDRLIGLCDAVIVDVSSPSPNLEWEIATLNSGGKPWIALGQLDRLASLQRDASSTGIDLQQLIGGRTVLAYRDEHPLALAQTLSTALNSTVA